MIEYEKTVERVAQRDCANVMKDQVMATDELVEYQARLDELMDSDSPDIFGNYTQNHARRIIRTFFASAEKSIMCLSGDFGNPKGVYGEAEIESALREAVGKGVDVRVISLNVSPDSISRLNSLCEELNKEVAAGDVKDETRCCCGKVRHGSFAYKLGVVTNPKAEIHHYLIVDGKRYRLEAAHSNPVGCDVHAEVCCNGPLKAASLKRDFDTIWGKL